MSVHTKIEDFKLFVKRNEPSSPYDAARSCWQKTPGISLPYVFYRWMQFVLHFMIALGSFLDYHRNWPPSNEAPMLLKEHGLVFYAKWFLHLTHWGCFLNMLQSLVGVVVLTTAYANRTSPGGGDKIYGVPFRIADIYCKLSCLATLFSIYIAAGFWLVCWNPEIFAIDLVVTSEHGGGAIFMLLDLFVVQFPYRMKTALDALGIVAAYMFLTLVHYWTGSFDRYQNNHLLYDVQDWDRPWPTILHDVGDALSLEALHLTLWGLYQVKRKLFDVNEQ